MSYLGRDYFFCSNCDKEIKDVEGDLHFCKWCEPNCHYCKDCEREITEDLKTIRPSGPLRLEQ